MSLAPIALSTYSRLSHLKQAVNALKANTLAKESDLYILSDAAKPGDEKKVDAVRVYLDTIKGFKNIHLIKRQTNSRIRNNRDGISNLLKTFGKCIYLEEDIVTAPGFLGFMNGALELYNDNDKIFSISGYTPPIPIPEDYRHDTFILRRASAWGMGLWNDRYPKIRYLNHLEVLKRFAVYKEVEALTQYGEDLLQMVLSDASGKIDALDVKIFYHQYLNDEYTVYPRKSLVRNIGFDGSGVHCDRTDRFNVELWNKLTFEMSDTVELNDKIIASNYEFRKIDKAPNAAKPVSAAPTKHRPKVANLGENLIFLISQPRAGSTMLQRVMGSHSKIDTASEPWIMLPPLFTTKAQLMKAPYEAHYAKAALQDFVRNFPEKDELFYEAVRKYALTFYNRSLKLTKKAFFLDKTPRYHMIIPELKRCFPNAKFILLFRNPMAVMSSMLLSWFQNDPKKLRKDQNYYDLVEAPQNLLDGIKILGKRGCVVHYEKLVSDTKRELGRLCQWLNIEFEPDMINYGDKKFNGGRFGDKIGICRHSQPATSSMDKWKLHLSDPSVKQFARKVFRTIRPEQFNKMGYEASHISGLLESDASKSIVNTTTSDRNKTVDLPKPGEKKETNIFRPAPNIEGPYRNQSASSDLSSLPCISVVTPSFNQGRYLEACIQSIVRQAYPNIEYIIMDGGSTDGSREIIEKYTDKLVYWRSEPDKGQYWAINEGFKRCTGHIMTWLNADDIFDPSAFKIAASIFMHRPEIDWITGRRANIDASGKKLTISNSSLATWSRNNFLLERAYHKPFIQQEGTFWTRSLWKKAGAKIDTTLSLAGDLELWARFFRYAKLYSVDYGLAFYRMHGENRALKFMDQYMEEAEKVIERESIILNGERNSTPGKSPLPISKNQVRRYLSCLDPIWNENVRGGPKNVPKQSPGPMVASRLARISDQDIDQNLMPNKGPLKARDKDHCSITIILPTKDRANGLMEVLDSVSDAMQDISYEIILYADKEDDGIKPYLEKFPVQKVFYDHQVFGEGESFSWAKMMNHGFAHASGDWIIYGSDDIVFYPGCFKNAISLIEARKDPKIGGVTFLHRNTAETYDGFFTDFGYDTLNADKPFINFGLIKAKAFHNTKGFDQKLRFFWADVDICVQLIDNGYTIVPSIDSLVDHNNILETTQKQQRTAMFEKDTHYFLRKWKHVALFHGRNPLEKVRFFVDGNQSEKIKRMLMPTHSKNEKTTGRRKPHVVIDGVIFQLQAGKPRGISRVWQNLIPELQRMMPEATITLLQRKGYALPFDSDHILTVPCYRLGDTAVLDEDDEMLMRTCSDLGADLFISTYYTRAPGLRNIVMVHDLIPEKLQFDLSQPEWVAKQQAVETADAFICVSNTTQEDLVTLYPQIADRPIIVSHNGLERIFKQPSSEEVERVRAKLELGRPYVMLVGNRRGYKCGTQLLTALSKLPDNEKPMVLCVGGEYPTSTEELNLSGKLDIKYTGQLDDKDLIAAYGGAYALMVPSLYEGFGLPVIEAMACGCPVITHRSHAVSEIGGDAVCYADLSEATAIQEALDQFKDPSHRKAYIQKGKEQVKKYNWSVASETIQGFFKSLMHKPSILLTAIVSTYNAAEFIQGCLEDLTQQTIADRMEILVVDSASDQDEGTVVRGFQRRYPNIKYIRTPVRETVYQAWNRGIKFAKGKYVSNANTDDRHRQDAFEQMVRVLEEDENIALVYADVIKTRIANETFRRCTPAGMHHWYDWDRGTLMEKGCFIGPQPVWRKVIHKEYGYFDERYEVSADFEFWLRISQTNEFYHIDKPLGLYLDRPDSIEHANVMKKRHEDEEIFHRYRTAAKEERYIGKLSKINRALNVTSSKEGQARGHAQSDHRSKSTNTDIMHVGGQKMHSPKTILQTVETLVDSGQNDSAMWVMDKLLTDFPNDARLHSEMAALAYGQADVENALEHFKRAAALEPQNILYLKDLGDFFYVVEKDTEKALVQYESVLNVDPNHTDALIMAGHVSVSLHRYSQGQQYYQRALDLDPQNSEVLQILDKMSHPATEHNTSVLSDDALYAAAQSKVQEADSQSAISLLEQMLARDDTHALAHNDLGVLQYESGNLQTALNHYLKAAELQPENEIFQKNLADFYLAAIGDLEKAMQTYVNVLKLNPRDVEVLLSCSQICLSLDKVDDARDFIQTALKLEPWNENAKQMMQQVDQPVVSGDSAGADLYNQAKAKASQGDLHGAIHDLLQYVIADPDNANAHNDLGVLYFETGEKDKAVASYEQAVQLAPSDPTYRKNLADFYLVVQQRIEEAMKLYLSVLQENPQDIESLIACGMISASVGQSEDAKLFYHRVLEIEPWNETARRALENIENPSEVDAGKGFDAAIAN